MSIVDRRLIAGRPSYSFAYARGSVADPVSICLAGACAVHCVATPAAVALLPVIGLPLANPAVEWTLVLLSVGGSAAVLVRGCLRSHRRWWALLPFVAGAGALLLGRLLEDASAHVGTGAVVAGAAGIIASHVLNIRWCRKAGAVDCARPISVAHPAARHRTQDASARPRRVSPDASMAERRTMVVAALAAVTMAAEIGGGLWSGSMALLADGLHMASHTLAMSIAVIAYAYARRHAASPRFAFGTGKVNALGGYTGGLVLGASAIWIAWEGLERMWQPAPVHYREAIALAVVGLVVNVISVLLLRDNHTDGGGHVGCSHGHDHNLRAAYLHVAADAVTSTLAIVALVAGRTFGLAWTDPVVGILGGGLVAWWSIGLLRTTSSVLLDQQAPGSLLTAIRRALDADRERITDLRCWAVAPGRYAVTVCFSGALSRTVAEHKRALLCDERVAWTAVEVSV